LSPKNPKKLNWLIAPQLALLCVVTTIVMFWVWVYGFSKACQIKTPGLEVANLVWATRLQERASKNLAILAEVTQADNAALVLYDPDLRSRSLFAEGGSIKRSASLWIDISQDVVFQEQLDYHKSNYCFRADVKRLRDSLYKRSAVRQGATHIFSCPVYFEDLYLAGFIAVAYRSETLPLEPEMIEAHIQQSDLIVIER